jgi:serine/threonine protein kinase
MIPDAVRKSPKSPNYRNRGFPRDHKEESVHRNLRLDLPVRSAPASGFSSPALSPRRYNTLDLFPTPPMISQRFQTSSPSELTNTTPLHSPKLPSPSQNVKCPNRVCWREGNNSNDVHPLPLPPGVSRPLQSPATRHVTMYNRSDESFVKGQWQKGKLIGRGTYGSVYIAINRETGASCAMKEVDVIPDDSTSAECIKQLEQEIKILQSLKHPNIVQYYGSETIDNRFCIYLEYIHPGSLSQYAREYIGAVTESVVRNFTRHIVSGLAYLHSTKTIHRDIKGANLLVNSAGVVKLADFGLAKHLSRHVTDLSLKGSPHWMAPEVLQTVMRKDKNPEHAFAVDIWSLGCTVIEMLTGKPPWSEFTGVQAMFSVLNRSPTIPETLSSEGKEFLKWCFQRNPADRPSAIMLLDHPFLRNPHDHNASHCAQEFSIMKINPTSRCPREWSKRRDSVTLSPTSWIKNGKIQSSETSPKYSPEASENVTTARLSPRSTLEVIPTISSPELNMTSNSHTNNFQHRTENQNPYAFLRTNEKGNPYL